ncbi:asparagine synthase (glutamine-hydrolyzing) [Arenimonas oryziterrae]|uniref:asparagine synthase (glutamine-hydrolyzing) n=1 Tax=Arenimonas oryziterrae DSM 21050 = YC6267 TaxID=1121015 RepID=A0A091B0I6_9GAMM|nr:asparagine synthase (glutamine-hydrolyzing) [Arenimonas oryziterrae]KFN45077.1 hypothetical protein N789_03380 [Arenimonas oryziterrae DSM 21050 = YC6267]
MCGLSGYFRAEALASAEMESVLSHMIAQLAHRGPDAEGRWCDPAAGIALGHRRLSVVDLSPAGAQPMRSHDGRFVIVYNGEIYNTQDVRTALDADAAIAWRGHSDTEVLIEAVVRWGLEATLRRLEGMFAFALWDCEAQVLHLARDRFGEKPLYYGVCGSSLVFASELKALRAYPGYRPEIDRTALGEYLRFGYVPAPRSIYRDTHKLPAGCFLSLRRDTIAADLPAPTPYWSAEAAALSARERPYRGSEDEAVEELDGLLRQVVGSRMQADVPLGALLSGGIDSSTVVALMQAQRGDRVRTFCIGSREPGFDEAEHARAVAKHLGTDHTELYVQASDGLAIVPRLPELYDEPFADSSQIPTFLVSQLARRQVTVALSGDAGDELFGGYNRYLHGERLWRRLVGIPRGLRSLGARGITAASPATLDRAFARLGRWAPGDLAAGRAGDKLHKLAGFLSADSESELHGRMLSYWPEPDAVVKNAQMPRSPAQAVLPGWRFAERAMLADTQQYLPDDILAKVDRASMGVSLEARVPFLDTRVFDLAWRLPMAMKIADGRGKQVLRRVLYRYVPPAIVDRPKQGFAVPVGQWLRAELREWAEALIAPERLQREGYFHPEPIQRCWQEHQSGKRNWDTRLWSVLMFQAWLEHQQTEARA